MQLDGRRRDQVEACDFFTAPMDVLHCVASPGPDKHDADSVHVQSADIVVTDLFSHW